MGLQDKVAIVTGGSLGIGRAAALRFAEEGAAVVIADIDEEAGRRVVRRIAAQRGKAFFFRTDVSQEKDTLNLVERTLEKFSRLDVLVNCAGIYFRDDVPSTSLQMWNRMLAINLTGVFLCCKAAIPAMRATHGGAIVNVSSSVGSSYAAPGIAAYAASKFGVTGLTLSLACDHIKDGIRVNAVGPGPTDTTLIQSSRTPEQLRAFIEKQPSGRLASPEEVAAAVAFLASDEASFITGIFMPVDGGQGACR